MFVKIGIAVTTAIALLAVAPNPSFAASKKKHTHVTTESCEGGGCATNPNPDRVQQCAGGDPVSCYKRSRTHHVRKRT
jgi:hypothetical protein